MTACNLRYSRPALIAATFAALVCSTGIATAQPKIDLSITGSVQHPLQGAITPSGDGTIAVGELVKVVCTYRFTIPVESEHLIHGGLDDWFIRPPPWRGAAIVNGETIMNLIVSESMLAVTKEWSPEQWNTDTASFEGEYLVTEPGSHQVRCLADINKNLPDTNWSNNSNLVTFSGFETPLASTAPELEANVEVQPPHIPMGALQAGVEDPSSVVMQPVMAKLVTLSAQIDPAQPTEDQFFQLVATVRNEGSLASQQTLFRVDCQELPGQPHCPLMSNLLYAKLPSIEPNTTRGVVVKLYKEFVEDWKPGKYRLLAGTLDQMAAGSGAHELELTVRSATPPTTAEAIGQRAVPLPGEAAGLNPQPEPPSAAARPGLEARPGPLRAPTTKSFPAPAWNGKRVDLCLIWGGQCGEPAATEFCKRSGYAKATTWTPANDIGAQSPTVVLSSGQVCSDASCDGFASITCSK